MTQKHRSKCLTNGFAQFNSALSTLLGISLWLMAAALTIVVLLRYCVGYGATWLNDVALYLLATLCLLGLSETFTQNRHVRLDIIYNSMSHRMQAWINLLGHFFILIPFCIFITVNSFDYVARSWQLLEGSGEAAGLGGLYLIKTLLLIGPSLLALQAFQHSLHLIRTLKKDNL